MAIIGYRNSPAYIQRIIDRILRKHREYSRVYIDNIVIFFNFLKEHIRHFESVFSILQAYNLYLSPEKSFVGYSNVALLG